MFSYSSDQGRHALSIIYRLLAFSLMVLIGACASFDNSYESKTLDVTLPDPNRIQFQGKGAGAGVALMSTMGPMGVALGVAIDEGIAKDIREVAADAGFSIEQAVADAVAKASGDAYKAEFGSPEDPEDQSTFIVIKSYGFRSIGGEGDPTHAEIIVELHQAGQEVRRVEFPGDNAAGLKTVPLEVLKRDGAKARVLLEDGFETSIELLLKAQS